MIALSVVMYKWCSSLPDDSLTPHTLLPAVSSVRLFWRGYDDEVGLLELLGVPNSVMDDIRASPSHSTEEEKRIAGLQYYLQTVPGASWEDIAGILWCTKEHTALEEVRQHLPRTYGECILLLLLLILILSTLACLPQFVVATVIKANRKNNA